MIRYIVGPMPFDRNGRHCTGREVYQHSASGNMTWVPEYEGDTTTEMAVTESDRDYDVRWWEYHMA